MRPKIIRTAQEHAAALARIEQLFDAKEGTAEFDELEVLALLVDQYESVEFPIDAPSPVEAIRFRMDQQGLRPKDLVPHMGSAARVSEVLSGRRRLSLAMIRKLSTGLGIPAEILIRAPGKVSLKN